jgi:hypothetical protein
MLTQATRYFPARRGWPYVAGVKTKPEALKRLIGIHQSARMHWVGNGFPVRSVFDYHGLGRELSPFQRRTWFLFATSRAGAPRH